MLDVTPDVPAHANGPAADDDLARTAARILIPVVDAFEEDVGDRPRLAELVEALGWAVPSGEPCLEAPSAVTEFRVRRRRRPPDEASRVGDLGDAVFAEAAEALAELAREIGARQQRPVTLTELAAALTSGIRITSGLASDGTEDLVAIDVVQPKVARRMKFGDIVAIPEEQGYRLAVVLAKNVWGTALGLFAETFPSPRAAALGTKATVPYVVHTDEQQLVNGVWKVVGHDESLIALFPEPEIYHAPNPNASDPTLHGYGAAETVDGRLRPISEEEARRVGLTDGSYDQGYLSEHLDRIITTIR